MSERFIELWNTWQARYLVGFAYSLAVLEAADMVLRWRGYRVELVSQSMKRIVFSGMTGLAFFFGSMTVHWFVTWHRMTWNGPTAHVLGAFFWLVFLAYALASWFDPAPRYWPVVTQWLRYPPLAVVIGGVLAYLCFPQRSPWFPGGAT